MNSQPRIALALFLLRLSIFAVMLTWTIDKFVRPEHASEVYEHFYYLSGIGKEVFYVIGIAELLLIAGFMLGFMKTITYGAVFILHTVSTLSSYQQYLSPYSDVNLLFFAAWPMLAACFTVFYLRDLDTLLVIEKKSLRSQ